MQPEVKTAVAAPQLDDAGLFQKLRLMGSYAADRPGWPQSERDIQKLTADAIEAAWAVLVLKRRSADQVRFVERWWSVLTSAIDAWLPRSNVEWDLSKYEQHVCHFTDLVRQFLVQQMFAILVDVSIANPLRAAATAAACLLFLSVAEESPRPYGFEPARLQPLLRAKWLPAEVRNLVAPVLNNARDLGNRRGEKILVTEALRLVAAFNAEAVGPDAPPNEKQHIAPEPEAQARVDAPRPVEDPQATRTSQPASLPPSMPPQPSIEANRPATPATPAAPIAVAANFRSGTRLIGWHDILKTLTWPNNQNTRRRLRSYCKQHDGPIKSIGRRPTVDEGELIAWFSSLDERAAAAEAGRKAVAGSRTAELDHPLEQKVLGLHMKSRRNKKRRGTAGDGGTGP